MAGFYEIAYYLPTKLYKLLYWFQKKLNGTNTLITYNKYLLKVENDQVQIDSHSFKKAKCYK